MGWRYSCYNMYRHALIDKKHPVPFYLQLQKNLGKLIKEGELKPLERIPSELKLAQNLGLSRMTTRLAMESLVNEGLLYRVQGKGTFVSKEPFLKTGNIGFIFSGSPDTLEKDKLFCHRVFEGIEKELQKSGHDLITSSMSETVPKFVKSGKASGLILYGFKNIRSLPKELMDNEIPTVLIESDPIKDNLLDNIVIDNIQGAYQAANYLISLGHQRIAFVADNFFSSVFQERFKGYMLSLNDAGIKYKKNLVKKSQRWNGGYLTGKRILSVIPLPTAIFVGDDTMAMGVVKAIKEKGLSIPEDISIVGFNDSEFSRFAHPSLTTVRVPYEEMGRIGVKRLMERLKNPSLKPEIIRVKVELVKRESCRRIGLQKTKGI